MDRVCVGVAVILAFGISGCGSDGNDANAPSATVGTSGAQLDVENTINYGSFGTTADIDCAAGKSLNVVGSNNTLTVRGTCATVNVGGSDNRITFAKVDREISVLGIDNALTYSDGEPTVKDVGSGNSVKKG